MLSSWISLSIYGFTLSVLALYGAHRLLLVWLLARGRRPPKMQTWRHTPSITLQLPVYNEPAVITRLIDAVAGLDWPAHKLQIQLLDDSTDSTCALADQQVAKWRRQGIEFEVIRRTHRTGFKAGALAMGLQNATGDFIAILDADFVPNPDFLTQLMPFFSEDVGMVQARWGHLNRDQDWLTRLQALLLDGHFVIEHAARHASGRFFNFNGTAGIWRKECIVDAGGWAHDTITEDLDLSYRAQLKGWRFVFLPDVIVPAELPLGMPAFATQQHRWAKGTVQTFRKLIGPIFRARLPWSIRMEALAHLSNPIGYPLLILLAVFLPPAVAARATIDLDALLWIDMLAVGMTTGSIAVFYGEALRRQGKRLLNRCWEIPLTMALGVGIAASQTFAFIDGLVSQDATFVRTPKHGGRAASGTLRPPRTRSAGRWLTWTLAVYYAGALVWAVHHGHWTSLPFMMLFAVGFWMTGLGFLPAVKMRQTPAAVSTETGGLPASK